MATGERIRNIREDNDVLQQELADAIGMNVSVLSRIEKGTRQIRDDELVKIANKLHVTTDYLLGRTDEPQGTGFQKGLLGNSNDLAEKVGRQAEPATPSSLTPDELVHIENYRALSDEYKQIIDMNIDQLKDIINNSKKE